MAGVKISALPAIPSAALTDIFASVQAGVTYKVSNTQLATLFNAQLSFLPLSGGTLTGSLILNADPTLPLGAATKNYVDVTAQGITVQGACRLGTTANLTATYSNGTSGVGATLTNSGTQAALFIDGVAAAVNDRILVKNQSTQAQNGIYVVTNIGSGSTNWVLTRSSDYDMASQIQAGDLVIVTAGNTQTNSSWLQTDIVTTIGTDAIAFTQFSASLPISIPNGGTGVSSVTTAPTASMWAGWDANKNLSANNHIEGYATTATAAGTTTLTVGSAQQQYFTGITTQTVLLPVTSTLVLGQSFTIVNNSTGIVTVQSSGANTIKAMAANSILIVTCILTSGTTAASWNYAYASQSGAMGGGSGVGPINQVVSTTLTTAVNTSSATPSGITGLTVAITPTATTSKVLVRAVINYSYNANANLFFTLTRGGTQIGVSTAGSTTNAGASISGNLSIMSSLALEFVDSPSSVSSLTYGVNFSISSSTLFVNENTNGQLGGVSTITAMEIL